MFAARTFGYMKLEYRKESVGKSPRGGFESLKRGNRNTLGKVKVTLRWEMYFLMFIHFFKLVFLMFIHF